MLKLRFQLLHHGLCSVKAISSLQHVKLLQEIRNNWNFGFRYKDTKGRGKLLYCVKRPTFMLVRCSSDMTCTRTEEEDADIKVSQTAQWKTSTLVMWSFSWRARKKNYLLFGLKWKRCFFLIFFFLPSSTLSSTGRLNRRLLCSITSCRKLKHRYQSDLSVTQISWATIPSYLEEGYGQVVIVVLLLNVLHCVPVGPAFQVILQLLKV